MPIDTAVARVREYFETLSPAALGRLGEIYAADARFKDPFNEVRGLPAVRRIFEHMYEQLEAPRFVVLEAFGRTDQAFLSWEFRFRSARLGRGEQCIRGASHLRFDASGLVAEHRDYWDAAEELYAKLPAIGGLLRWLRRRLAVS